MRFKMGKMLNLSGQKFNDLLVIKFSHIKTDNQNKTRSMWICLCDCGNICVLQGSNLKIGHVKSCGCKKHKLGKNHPNSNYYNDLSGQYWLSLKHGAEMRKIPFNITKEEAWQIWEKQNGKCALTNLPISLERTNCKDNKKLQTASFDRIDSSDIYKKSNMQWVHKDINKMKQSFSQDRFIELCKLVVENNK